MEFLENKTFDEIKLGDAASTSHTLTLEDIQVFASLSGDVNPTHLDAEFAAEWFPHKKITGHSLWAVNLLSGLLSTKLPGPGCVYQSQNVDFKRSVNLGEKVTVTIKAIKKIPDGNRVIFACHCIDEQGQEIYTGTAEVFAPAQKIKRPRADLPKLYVNRPGTQLKRLVDMTENYPPIRMAVVHPVDHNSLLGAIEAAERNLIIPVLVGPINKIRAAAEEEDIDLSDFEVIDTEHSHEAASRAVALARSGEVKAIMKGSLHTDELMRAAVQKSTGIGTARRMSHVFLMDVPTYPRPLLVTDAAINIDPNLEEKKDIVQNAIELARALGVQEPKVALLSAVETVNSQLRSTLEAAALCKMAHRKQIVGGIIDGPLAFDNAVSLEAAKIKGIESDVAGQADILVAPDLEAGNMVAKQLEYLASAQSSGIVLGARVPIALTSRADSVLSRMASCAIALLLVRNKQWAIT